MKIFLTAALFFIFVFTSAASAKNIEIISLLERQGKSDTALLIGATEEQKANFIPGGELNSQILAFYLKTSNREILFDTGLRNGNIVKRLEENGIKNTDVKTILLTHLHPDHFGGLVDSNGKAAYPNAEIYVSKIEYDYWVSEIKNENVIEAMNLYSKNLHFFDFGDEIFDGIKALDASGHTPGHTVFDVKNDGEELLIVGDIMHFVDIQLPVPEVSVKYDVDPDKARESRKKILDYAAEKNIKIAGMHITSPGIIKVKKNSSGYEKIDEAKAGNKIYFAGPLFCQAEKDFNLKLTEILEKHGYEVFLPQRDGFEAALLEGKTEEELTKMIFEKDVSEVKKADIIFMNLDGRIPD
ncbi:MAG: MBL fold metallo-hydrolase, partial [Synergistaceae bacterium]|nr:MBL fold metallo-hydrolase [Synergistaceae bacterium]